MYAAPTIEIPKQQLQQDCISVPSLSACSLGTIIWTLKSIPAEEAWLSDVRRKQSAVGTPDYLAPEILLGMPHGLLH